MADNASPVDPESTTTPLEHRIDDRRQSGRTNTAEPTNKNQQALQRLFEHLRAQREWFIDHKKKVDEKRKELTSFKVSVDHSFTFADLPITENRIEQVVEALKDDGRNVKELQKALGIFEMNELTRLRKGLVIAGVIQETENHKGSNMTWIELTPEFKAAVAVVEK